MNGLVYVCMYIQSALIVVCQFGACAAWLPGELGDAVTKHDQLVHRKWHRHGLRARRVIDLGKGDMMACVGQLQVVYKSGEDLIFDVCGCSLAQSPWWVDWRAKG
jgi:hypothetical protein